MKNYISTTSTNVSRKASPSEEHKVYNGKNLKSLKENIISNSKNQDTLSYDSTLSEKHEIEKLYDFILSGSFKNIRALESIKKAGIDDTEDAKLLNHIGSAVRKNNLFDIDYVGTNIDNTELAVTIADQLECMGEEVDFYS